MQLITAEQMRALEHVTIHERGIPGLTLMEAGGCAAAVDLRVLAPQPTSVGIFVGPGNNGGDALVAARHLAEAGYTCTLYCLCDPEQYGRSARNNWDRLPTSNITIIYWTPGTALAPLHTVLLDGLFGIGINAVVADPYAALIAAANDYPAPIVAIDIPSGIHTDTGAVCGVAIRATRTATFGLPKRGLLVGDSADYVGTLTTYDVGFPADLVAAIATTEWCNDPAEFAASLPHRTAATHKHECGHTLVIAGSRAMPGAGYLAARAALRAGAGLATYALPASVHAGGDPQTPEVMCASWPDADTGQLHPTAALVWAQTWARAQAVVLGPGLGQGAAVTEAVRAIVRTCPIPLVLDADALTIIADDLDLLRPRMAPTVLTPHPGEMARLCRRDSAAVQADRLGMARTLAQRTNAIVVLKGARTIIAQPNGHVWINATGNPALATAGSGDVLAGLIGGLLAQRMPTPPAVRAAVYLHGAAADLWAATNGVAGMLASDLLEYFPRARMAAMLDFEI